MTHNDAQDAMLKGITAGLLMTTAIGLAAGLIAAIGFWPWPADMGERFTFAWNFLSVILSGLVVGGMLGLVVGTSLAWHGGIIGSTLDRGDAAPIYGVLTGLILGGSLGPVVGGVLGLLLGQLLGGAALGLVLGPIVGILGWEAGYWRADFVRGGGAQH